MNRAISRHVKQPKRKPIDLNVVKKMFEMYCTVQEVVDAFDVSINTLRTRVKEEEDCTLEELYLKHRNIGNVSLRRTGYLMAQEDKTVWIFFAKNNLGMSDKQEINLNGTCTNITNNSVVLQMSDEQKLKTLEHMKSIGLLDKDGNIVQKEEIKNE